MNLVKKVEQRKIVIFMEERDFSNPPDIIIENLKEIIAIATDYDIQIKMQDVKDIPVAHFAILLSFCKSMKIRKTAITIKCGKDLLYSLLDVGLGSLVYAIEEI